MKRGIIEENKHEQPAGTVYAAMKLVVREIIMVLSISFQMNFSFFFFFNGFDFQAKFDKPNQFKKYLACDVHFVCATQKT